MSDKKENQKVLKKVESKEEYYSELKVYKKKINKLFRSGYKMLKDPDKFIENYETLLAEMEFIGLVTPEWSQSQRMRLFSELNKPNEFKDWVETGFKNIRKKLSFKRKKELDEEIKKINGFHDFKVEDKK